MVKWRFASVGLAACGMFQESAIADNDAGTAGSIQIGSGAGVLVDTSAKEGGTYEVAMREGVTGFVGILVAVGEGNAISRKGISIEGKAMFTGELHEATSMSRNMIANSLRCGLYMAVYGVGAIVSKGCGRVMGVSVRVGWRVGAGTRVAQPL
jgi:hypothetical protein